MSGSNMQFLPEGGFAFANQQRIVAPEAGKNDGRSGNDSSVDSSDDPSSNVKPKRKSSARNARSQKSKRQRTAKTVKGKGRAIESSSEAEIESSDKEGAGASRSAQAVLVPRSPSARRVNLLGLPPASPVGRSRLRKTAVKPASKPTARRPRSSSPPSDEDSQEEIEEADDPAYETWQLDDPRFENLADNMLQTFNAASRTPFTAKVVIEKPDPEIGYLPAGVPFAVGAHISNFTKEEAALASIFVKENTISSIRWDLLSVEILQYVAAHLEGDGTIRMEEDQSQTNVNGLNANSCLHVDITKAANAWPTLYVFRRLFGGIIKAGKKENGNTQAQRYWKLAGFSAYELVKNLLPFLTIKKPQWVAAAGYRYGVGYAKLSQNIVVMSTVDRRMTRHVSLGAYDAEEYQKGQNHREHGQVTIKPLPRQKIGKILKWYDMTPAQRASASVDDRKGNTDKWQVLRLTNPWTKEEGMAEANIRNVVRNLKRQPHPTIDNLGLITPAFAAGFVDSDGCLHLSSNGSKIYSIFQKYRAICDAFQAKFGGSVRNNPNPYGDFFVWSLRKADVQAFEQQVFPFLIEKYKQGEILLQTTRQSTAVDRQRLAKLKGGRLRLRLDLDDDRRNDFVEFPVELLEAELEE